MPLMKRTTLAPAKKTTAKATTTNGPVLTLPTSVYEVSDSLDDFHFLIHGEKKIGKTTLAAAEENILVLTFDPIRKAYAIKQVYCDSWKTFMGYLKLLEEAAKAGKYPYKRVVVDGSDIWYRRCEMAICRELGIDDPADEKWGKAYNLIKSKAADAVDRLLALPGGCWFIAHSQWKEVETRTVGQKIEKLLPVMKSGADEIISGRVDGWLAYDYIGNNRALIILGDERTGAGHAVKGHFLTPDGHRVREIPMGNTEEEAWENFKECFHNRQKFATIKEGIEGGMVKKESAEHVRNVKRLPKKKGA